MANRRELLALLALVGVILLWSLVSPHDYLIWLMEALPVLVGVPLLLATHSRFPLTRLCYYLLALEAVVLLVGAHHTYARVPVGDWVSAWLEIERNHYDRFAHITQGFVPAILVREILIRFRVVRGSGWLFLLVTCVCLAISALYELLEWQAAVWGGDASLDFLGVQGDVWDAQWDMLLALVGAIVAQCILARRHNRQIDHVMRAGG